MEPTLEMGDRVLVEKVRYRFGSPSRGDVVVFERGFVAGSTETNEPFWTDVANAFRGLFGLPTGSQQDFIKRVVAVGGDDVEGRGGKVVVNGKEIDEPYLAEGTQTPAFPATHVPEGSVFVMGDNRANSEDSRTFGPVPVSRIVGHAFVLVWPPSNLGTL
jgi:signal peptidase I